MNKTSIEWVKNPDGSQGFTWNPITGCLNHDNGLCKGGGFPCYAYKLAHGRLKQRYLANGAFANLIINEGIKWPIGYHPTDDPFYPRFWDNRLLEVQNAPKNCGIFVCDMSDLFGTGIPKEWTTLILDEMRMADDCRFYLLTKQPQKLPDFSPFPDNCWVGVTITNRIAAHNASHYLPLVKAKVRFISYEPLLDDVTEALYNFNNIHFNCDWLIVGSQTKPYKPPQIEWVHKIVKAADEATVPVFLKDNLAAIIPVGDSLLGDEDAEFKWRLRQDMPVEVKIPQIGSTVETVV